MYFGGCHIKKPTELQIRFWLVLNHAIHFGCPITLAHTHTITYLCRHISKYHPFRCVDLTPCPHLPTGIGAFPAPARHIPTELPWARSGRLQHSCSCANPVHGPWQTGRRGQCGNMKWLYLECFFGGWGSGAKLRMIHDYSLQTFSCR